MPMISLIIPCKNEFGTIFDAISLGTKLPYVNEIIIVVGQSHDKTFEEAIRARIELANEEKVVISVLDQNDSSGKWNAVKAGIKISNNENISIWDADLTVSFSEQCLMHERFMASITHRTEDCLVIGDRMTFREPGSMRFANFIGNKIFAQLWTGIAKIRINDMLCGSKIFSKRILDSVPEHIKDKDPYGDFTLVLGAVTMRRKIEVQTVSYRARTYGQTNILRWSGAMQLFRFSLSAIIFIRKNRRTHVK